MNTLTKQLTALEKSFLGFPFAHTDTYFNLAKDYPFYDILQDTSGNIILNIALAGWNKKEITIQVKNDEIEISGTQLLKDKSVNPDAMIHVHRGISQKDFSKSFKINSDVIVDSAEFKDGILVITMHREIPDAHKPRFIKLQ